MFESGSPAWLTPAGTSAGRRQAVNAVLESALATQPGPAMVARLAGVDPGDLDETGRVLLLRALERQSRWLAGLQQRALAAVAGPRPSEPEADDWACNEVAAALLLAPGTAQARVEVARALAGPLAATAAALERGELTVLHAAVLAEETARLAPALATAVQTAVLGAAGRQPPGRFRRTVIRAVAAADPVGVEVAHAVAVADRGVRIYPEPNGMAVLEARLAAEGAEAVFTALTALAERACAGPAGAEPGRPGAGPAGAEVPGIDVRRADALVELARTALDDPRLPTSHRRRPHVAVTVDLPTLLGLAEHPGELAGYGPIPAAAARALAADGAWRRLVTDPLSGALLDYGRRTYTPPADLAAFVIARDGTCRFPGCGMPAVRCDLDHAVPWEDGGGTDRDNIGPLCRRHHRLKTHTGWRLRRNADDSVTWTSPAGAIYTLPPPRIPPDG